MSIVLLCDDMMMASKVAAAAGRVGLSCSTAMSVSALGDKLVEGVRLVVIDLSTSDLVPSVVVPKIRTTLKARPRIIAFGPHVKGELLEEAETSGCDAVYSNGEFFARLGQLLGEFVDVAS